MGKEAAVKKTREIREEVRRFVAELRQKVYGEQGCPDWGTLALARR